MIKRSPIVCSLALMFPLALAAFLMQATHASSQDGKSPIEVRVDNFTFGPDTLTVASNTTVTWVNKDDIPHTVVSNDGVFKSKALDTEDKYSYVFTNPGTYSYFCSIHPKMVGKIVVK